MEYHWGLARHLISTYLLISVRMCVLNLYSLIFSLKSEHKIPSTPQEALVLVNLRTIPAPPRPCLLRRVLTEGHTLVLCNRSMVDIHFALDLMVEGCLGWWRAVQGMTLKAGLRYKPATENPKFYFHNSVEYKSDDEQPTVR